MWNFVTYTKLYPQTTQNYITKCLHNCLKANLMIIPNCNKDCLFFDSSSCSICQECTYCGSRLYQSGQRKNIQYDHIRPLSSGGRTVVPTCAECNQSKSNTGLKEWLRSLRYTYSDKWEKIVKYNKSKRNKIAQVVREVRDEKLFDLGYWLFWFGYINGWWVTFFLPVTIWVITYFHLKSRLVALLRDVFAVNFFVLFV